MTPIAEIKQQVRLSDVAAQYGDLRKRGQLQVCRCLCGENSDRNPSFTLYERGQPEDHFHCFACGRHGSVIDLVMLTEGLDVKAACQHLRERYLHSQASEPVARRAITGPVPTPLVETALRADVVALLRETVACYQRNLAESPSVQALLHQRGLSDDTLARLHIGYANGNLARHLHERSQPLSLAARIGLLTQRGELMQGRIAFPVLDEQDQPLFLLGRATLPGQQPKYLGLPDGLVHKRPMLCGVPKRGVVLVEGAVDFAALIQWGLPSEWLCIALLGTAHAQVVTHLANRHLDVSVVIALDQDKAGKEAALKAALALREAGIPSSIVVDADRYAQHQAQTAKPDSVQAEQSLIDEIVRLGLVRWVHWHNQAKDCGDLLMQQAGASGRELFLQALG